MSWIRPIPCATRRGGPVPVRGWWPAADGAVWLLGSDGGVTQVTDTFRDGVCPATGVSVQYGPVLRRQDGALPTNTVPALVVGRDGALWLGTALGLTRLHDGQLTPVLFDREVTVPGGCGHAGGLLSGGGAGDLCGATAGDGGAGGRVVCGGLWASAGQGGPDLQRRSKMRQGRLWVGTLGGGLRRIEVRDGVPQDTLHLTRQDGLGSNLILALAVGPDGALWAATDEGVSRRAGARTSTVEISNFAALEHVPGPVRKVAVDAAGTVWLATDAGLFRLQPGGGSAAGGTGRVASGPRLIPVAGNNQSALPGQELPTPLVVRLEDQFGAPVVGEPLTRHPAAGRRGLPLRRHAP